MIKILTGLGISMAINDNPDWVTRGKTIRQLIKELQSFNDLDMEVRISVDDGQTNKAISLVGKDNERCVLINSETINQDTVLKIKPSKT